MILHLITSITGRVTIIVFLLNNKKNFNDLVKHGNKLSANGGSKVREIHIFTNNIALVEMNYVCHSHVFYRDKVQILNSNQ